MPSHIHGMGSSKVICNDELLINHCKIITNLKKPIVINTPCAGFSLIEVLISILVLGLGAMAAISMQIVAMSTTQQSAYQSVAIQLGAELADKIRMRSAISTLAQEANPFLQLNYSVRRDKDIPAPSRNCFESNVNCAAHELAQFEIHEIKMRVQHLLPDGRIQVCRELPRSSEIGYDWSCANSDQSDAQIFLKFGWNGKQNADAESVGEQSPKLVLTAAAYVN